MANLQTSNIAIAKIKVRWEEPYVSEAVNRQATALPTGIYRGGILVPAVVPDQTIKIVPDDGGGLSNDTFFLIKDKTNDFGLVVRDPDEVILDLSAQIWPIPAPTVWHIWAKITYAVSTPTEAKYYVSDTPPTGDYVFFGWLVMSTGDTTIQASNINMDLRTKPIPTKRKDGAYVVGDEEYGLLDGAEAWRLPTTNQKEAADNATTAPTATNPFVTEADTMEKVFGEPVFYEKTGLIADSSFKLMGQFYVGKDTHANAKNYFSFRQFSTGVGDKALPLVKDFTGGALVYVDKIHKEDDSGIIIPSTDPGVDTNGFYTNPIIYMKTSAGAALYTGDLIVYCFRKKKFSALEQAPVQAMPDGGMDLWPHTSKIYDSKHTGSPDDVSFNSLNTHMGSFLGFINDRIKTIHPTASSASWVLLWRSNNVTLNADVDFKTISIYWCDGKYMMLINAYASSPTEITSGKILDEPVSMWLMDTQSEKYFLRAGKEVVAAGSTWIFGTRANWDTWFEQPMQDGFTGTTVAALASIGVSGGTEYPLNFYVGNPNGEKGFMLTFNAEWTGSAWEGYSGAADAFALLISQSGMKFFFKDNTTSSWNTTISAAGWTSEMHWDQSGGRMEAYQCMDGKVHDEVRYCLSGKNVGANPAILWDSVSVTWHAKLKSSMVGGDITVSVLDKDPVGWVSIPVVSNVDEYGCRLRDETPAGVAVGSTAFQYGKVVVTDD